MSPLHHQDNRLRSRSTISYDMIYAMILRYFGNRAPVRYRIFTTGMGL